MTTKPLFTKGDKVTVTTPHGQYTGRVRLAYEPLFATDADGIAWRFLVYFFREGQAAPTRFSQLHDGTLTHRGGWTLAPLQQKY